MAELKFHTWTPKDDMHPYPRKDIRGIIDRDTARRAAKTEAMHRRVDMQMWEKRLDYRSKWEKCGVVGVSTEGH